jgi:glycosyltransferase involved in cell wall biosynthesis
MVGTRGIPATYSGFETCVEQLSIRLVKRGHRVTVYCRRHHVKWPESTYLGVRLVKLPTIASKHLDTIVHTFLSMLHLVLRRFDVVYVCGVGNAPLAFIPRIFGKPTVVNVDGPDWQRDKWGRFAKRYLRFAERSAIMAPTCIIADSRAVERYYVQTYGASSIFIPYGSQTPRRPAGATLARFGLRPQGYIFWVGRLVPENNAHQLTAAYQRLGGPATGLALCIVGDAPYSDEYVAELKAGAGPGVIFTGYLFGEGYQELGSNARLAAFTSGVGGTHPALLEAMAFGNCIVVNDTDANRETIGDAGVLYPGAEGASGLANALRGLLASPERIPELQQRAFARASSVYSWEGVTNQYEALFARLACGQSAESAETRVR